MNETLIAAFLILFAIVPNIFSQDLQNEYNQYGEIIVMKLSTAPFPSAGRSEGHTYNDKFFSAEEHYSDSSVAVFIPKNYNPTDQTDFVIYFHGWGNNIDTSFKKFRLAEQFYNSGKNAILVFPEGPKNAQDSFGGKMEDKNGFKNLINDVVDHLHSKGKIKTKDIGDIILSGHSGAYRAIAYILMRGGLTSHVKEVYLFDALYAELEKYSHWICKQHGKLIDIYTENGGTKQNSINLMEDLDGWGDPYLSITEAEVTPDLLKSNELIFIASDLKHSGVVAERNQFTEFLKASLLKEIKK